MARLRRAALVVAAIALAAWLALAVLVASSQPSGEPPMRSVPVVTDPPADTPKDSEPTPKHIVIEGALP